MGDIKAWKFNLFDVFRKRYPCAKKKSRHVGIS